MPPCTYSNTNIQQRKKTQHVCAYLKTKCESCFSMMNFIEGILSRLNSSRYFSKPQLGKKFPNKTISFAYKLHTYECHFLFRMCIFFVVCHWRNALSNSSIVDCINNPSMFVYSNHSFYPHRRRRKPGLSTIFDILSFPVYNMFLLFYIFK